MKTLNITEIANILETPKNIAITSHVNPDGDAIGSSLAMYHYLIKKGHTVNVIIPNGIPDFLSWLPGFKNILIVENQHDECIDLLKDADIIFSLDYNSLDRVKDIKNPIINSNAVKILIDHHPDPDLEQFNFVYSSVQTSSASELVFDLICQFGNKDLIDLKIAECIYTGIITDTGSFSYLCNNEQTYQTSGYLIKLGVDGENIHRLIYDTFSKDRLQLLGYCLSEKLRIIDEYSTAYIYLSADDLKKFNYQIGDTENVVNYPLSMKGIIMSALFVEREDAVKLSFRSKGDFYVNEIAQKHFEGGGHKNAAGANSYLSLDDTLKKFEKLLPLYKEKLNL
ncbi:MAG: bifunctional oligoribonuclease/PAP phosphatase NrnA [Bacteroidales bacterium]|nr:bifunctional oligoribonuclease/PAP phosphatase NrnA [Bacteroidales bacterium]